MQETRPISNRSVLDIENMRTMKYKIIKTEEQYDEYCNLLEILLEQSRRENDAEDEIDLLTFLIEKWDSEHSTFNEIDPVSLLHSLMQDHNLKAIDLAGILAVSKGLVSDILNYKKGMSKETIRILSGYFKVSQEAFNRPYHLKNQVNTHKRDARIMKARN